MANMSLMGYNNPQDTDSSVEFVNRGVKMTMPTPPNWQTVLEQSSPELLKKVNRLRETVLADGALPVKTKTLMMMLCDALLGHSDGVANIAKRARGLGASEGEIAETLGVAFLMGGMPGLVTGANAFRDEVK